MPDAPGAPTYGHEELKESLNRLDRMRSAFVGRQPIFNQKLTVYGYELLFRSGDQAAASFSDGDSATATVVLNAFTDIGLQTLVGDHLAFVNLTKNLLINRRLDCLPSERVVLEVLEDVTPDEETVEAVRHLADLGYTIALDDFVYRAELEPLIELADIVKIEYPAVPPDELADHIKLLRDRGVKKLLAEKIETHEDFQRCRDLGCDLFQGYFFCKPQVISRRSVQNHVASVVRLVAELQDPNVSTARVVDVLQCDANLSYRLLRFVNSAMGATARKIESLRQATTLLGIQRIRSLASMMLLSSLDENKPRELINVALMRAKMCEVLATKCGDEHPERCYTLGLFSVLDAMLDQTMEDVVNLLPLSPDMNNALLHRAGRLGEILTSVVDFESGKKPKSVRVDQLTDAYHETLCWFALSQKA